MHINAINNSYNNGCQNNKNQNFGRLIKDKSFLPILNKMSAEDKIEFKKIEKRLSKTKFALQSKFYKSCRIFGL